MALTSEEKTSIVNAVLAALRSNALTVDQLTPVTALADGDSFEISGGKRVTYAVLSSLIAELLTTQEDASTIITELLLRKTGQPNGLAPLDAAAQVPEKHLPDAAIDVVRFGWFVTDNSEAGAIEVQTTKSPKSSYDGHIVYHMERNCFLLYHGGLYYTNWADALRFGLPFSDGVRPYAHKTYLCEQHPEGKDPIYRFYYWNGIRLDGIIAFDPIVVTYAWSVSSTDEKFTNLGGSNSQSITDNTAHVVYDVATNRFKLERTESDGKLALFNTWREFKTFGDTYDNNGVIPYPFKIYRNLTAVRENKPEDSTTRGHSMRYSVWDGTKLAAPLSAYTANATANVAKTTAENAKTTADNANATAENANAVVEFSSFTHSVTQEQIQWITAASSTSEGAMVCFNNAAKTSERRFLLNVGGVYYAHWADSDRFGIAHSNGVEPYPHKVYFQLVDMSLNGEEAGTRMERAYYRWDGREMSLNIPNNPAIVCYAYGVNLLKNGANNPDYEVIKNFPGGSAADPGCSVVYVVERNRFMLCVPSMDGSGVNYLYPNFDEHDLYGTLDVTQGSEGVIPYGFKLYRNTTSGEYQQWNGTKLTAPLSAYDVNAQLSSVVATYNSTILELRNTIDSLTARIEALETSVATQGTNIESLKTKTNNHNTILQAINFELNKLSPKVSNMEDSLDTTQERVQTLEDNLNGIPEKVAAHTSAIETLDGLVSEIESANDAQDTRLNEIEFAVLDPDTGLAKTTERVAALETRFADGVLLL